MSFKYQSSNKDRRYIFILFLSCCLLVGACSEQGNAEHFFNKGQYKQSYSLYLIQAEQGDVVAQNYVGIHHYLGLGTPRDYKKAKEWFEKAAINKHADAQYNLGSMYENGEYVAINYNTAYMWLYAAHKNGNSHAANRMWGITGEHKIFGNQVAQAEELAEPYIEFNK